MREMRAASLSITVSTRRPQVNAYKQVSLGSPSGRGIMPPPPWPRLSLAAPNTDDPSAADYHSPDTYGRRHDADAIRFKEAELRHTAERAADNIPADRLEVVPTRQAEHFPVHYTTKPSSVTPASQNPSQIVPNISCAWLLAEPMRVNDQAGR
ncbi:hypothetical protein E2C01_015076 [Portunus trituberculatus]|uniref:Uncharacterized protein n=1 Tax=Portunus trituberculatus TaxID=210409 RepID=A0A5B7DKQ2_PORTR|nr:hypothetical protein [Portunus trituberculatus]